MEIPLHEGWKYSQLTVRHGDCCFQTLPAYTLVNAPTLPCSGLIEDRAKRQEFGRSLPHIQKLEADLHGNGSRNTLIAATFLGQNHTRRNRPAKLTPVGCPDDLTFYFIYNVFFFSKYDLRDGR